MKALAFAFASLRHRLGSASMIALVLSLGIIGMALMDRAEKGMTMQLRNSLDGTDLLLCAKGSPTQSILAHVLHVDVASGNIPSETADQWLKHPDIRHVRRLAYGDQLGEFRILGCDSATWLHIGESLLTGRWPSQSMEAVIGSTVAQTSKLSVGDIFHGSHGMVDDLGDHAHHDYRVVGIVEASNPWDRIIFTPLSSVWDIHHDKDHSYTAVLASIDNPMTRLMLPARIQKASKMMAISPAMEGNRMMTWLNRGGQIMQIMTLLLQLIGFISLLLLLHAHVREHRSNYALMRAMGSTWWQVFQVVAWQNVLIVLAALSFTVIGLLMAYFSQSLWLPSALNIPNQAWAPSTLDAVMAGVALIFSGISSVGPWLSLKKISLHRALVDA